MASDPTGIPASHMHDDQGPRVTATMIALIILPLSFLMARLLSRRLAHAGYWWDDLLVIIACLLSIAPAICNLVAVSKGLGRHIYAFGPDAEAVATEYIKIVYFFSLFFNLATGFTKLAILAFYRRIFPNGSFRHTWIILFGIVAAFTTGAVLTIIFQCTPIHKFWIAAQPGHCISRQHDLYVTGAINTLLDFIVVALPVPLLWRLRTSTRQKAILTGIFLTAGFVCAASIVRLVVFSEADIADITWNLVGLSIWTAVEPCVGVVGACIPSLRPLVALLLGHSFAASSNKQAHSSSLHSSNFFSKSRNEDEDLTPISPLQHEQGLSHNDARGPYPWRSHDATVSSGSPKNARKDPAAKGIIGQTLEYEELDTPPASGIRVRTEVILSRSERLDYNDRLF